MQTFLRVAAMWLVLSGSPAAARADAIGIADACPPGSRGQNAHAGSWCVPATCTTSCGPIDGMPASCRPMRVCTRPHDVFAGAPAAAITLGTGFEPTTIDMVLETCLPSEACDGTGDRAPIAGSASGAIHCHIEDVCVRDALPSLASRLGPPPDPPAPTPPPDPPAATPAATASGCGCHAGRAGPSLGWWLPLAWLLVRRARNVALALALMLVASPAAAQLPAPWQERPLPAGFRDLTALACAGDLAYARSWQGQVAMLGADGWTALDDVPNGDVGDNLVVDESGVVLTTVRDGIARYEGGHWSREDAPLGWPYVSQIAAFDGHAIVGARGYVVAWSGTAYAAYDVGTWRDVMAVWGGSATDLWLGGAGGTAIHFDGHAPTPHRVPTTGTIVTLSGTSTRDVWAVTERPAGIFHWDGAAWADRTRGLEGEISAVHATEREVYAVGAFGVVRWSDDAWQDVHRVAIDPYAMSPFVDVCLTATRIVVGGRSTSWIRLR